MGIDSGLAAHIRSREQDLVPARILELYLRMKTRGIHSSAIGKSSSGNAPTVAGDAAEIGIHRRTVQYIGKIQSLYSTVGRIRRKTHLRPGPYSDHRAGVVVVAGIFHLQPNGINPRSIE